MRPPARPITEEVVREFGRFAQDFHARHTSAMEPPITSDSFRRMLQGSSELQNHEVLRHFSGTSKLVELMVMARNLNYKLPVTKTGKGAARPARPLSTFVPSAKESQREAQARRKWVEQSKKPFYRRHSGAVSKIVDKIEGEGEPVPLDKLVVRVRQHRDFITNKQLSKLRYVKVRKILLIMQGLKRKKPV